MMLEVLRNPGREVLNEVAVEAPENPFWTPSYLGAQRRLGGEVLLLACEGVHCPAMLHTGRLSRSLEIASLPAIAPEHPFWRALLAWRLEQGIARVELNTFASPALSLPALPGPWTRRARREFVLDLEKPDLHAGLSTNHARNIKRGRKSGIVVEPFQTAAACRAHVGLMQASLERRRQRGETVPDDHEETLRQTLALVESGVGTVFQARDDESVCSSILVLRAARGGYYQSAGSSPDGMSRGASHLLVLEIAARLRAEGAVRFNLGGVSEPGSGLEQFKSGFGTRPVELEAMEAEWTSPWRSMLRAGAARIRELVAR